MRSKNDNLIFPLDAPEIMLSQTKYSGEQGRNLNISINISANPRVDSVHLNMSGVEFNDANVTTSTDSIIFNELDRAHGGDYSVYGVNSEGEGPVTNFLLTVYCKYIHILLSTKIILLLML